MITGFSREARGGQVMILTVLALGGTILGATTIAGLLMLYQLRQTSDLASSAKAITAADAGIEWSFYNLFCKEASKDPCPMPPLDTFSNGASVKVTCYDSAGQDADCAGDSVRTIRSIGTSGNASRAFEANF